MSKYINPYTDFGFKKLFGEEANKDLLIDFLNSVLPETNRVRDLTFRNTHYLPDSRFDRHAVLDIACTGQNDETFIVEMQKAKQDFFKDRALFYSSYPIQHQGPKGDDWNFKLNPIFFIAVLDFLYEEFEELRKLQKVIMLKDEDNNVFSETLKMIFLQMPLFTKTESELVTQQDKWLYFLKNLTSLEDIPAILREPVFEKAFHLAEYYKLTVEEQAIYQADMKNHRDYNNTIRTAAKDGEARGIIKGRAEGMAEGIIQTAYNLNRLGVDYATIIKATGLSVDEIDKL
ncbi:MAG: Rpn family recombination-promoting nuclease/putative transposase [Planctomycetaceae bacterium]|jgi:predicted transposase/invertase (TIGR01784 family)|nr:Rpn family recombination-promoting nuclease/putative transposase [Planctomycetaceae bacterium]